LGGKKSVLQKKKRSKRSRHKELWGKVGRKLKMCDGRKVIHTRRSERSPSMGIKGKKEYEQDSDNEEGKTLTTRKKDNKGRVSRD